MSSSPGASSASRTSGLLVPVAAGGFALLMVTAAVVAVLFGVQP